MPLSAMNTHAVPYIINSWLQNNTYFHIPHTQLPWINTTWRHLPNVFISTLNQSNGREHVSHPLTHPPQPTHEPPNAPRTPADTELTFFIKRIDQRRNERNKTVAHRRCSWVAGKMYLKDKWWMSIPWVCASSPVKPTCLCICLRPSYNLSKENCIC